MLSRIPPYIPIPAFATSVSRRPNRSTAVAISRWLSAGERTSIVDRDDPAGELGLERVEALPASGADHDLGARTGSSRAVARPIPALAPVMTTTVSCKSLIAAV